MTDNGSAYRSHALAPRLRRARAAPHAHPALHAADQRQGRALHPDQPARMGLLRAFATSPERTAAMHPWLDHYNRHRPHSALGGQPPSTRLTKDNLLGNDT